MNKKKTTAKVRQNQRPNDVQYFERSHAGKSEAVAGGAESGGRMTATETLSIDIATFMPWGERKLVVTSRGERYLQKAEVTETFWSLWRSNKETLKAAGVSCSQRDGKWEVCWWQDISKEEKQAKEIAKLESRSADSNLEIPSPDGLDYLGYQRAGIAFAASRFASGSTGILIGDEMGLGKTIQLIGILNNDPTIKKVLVICPATLKSNWERELLKWLVDPRTVGIADGQFWPDTEIVIINFDNLVKWKKTKLQQGWDLVCVDEIQYCVNNAAQRTQAIFGYKPTKKEIAKGKVAIEPIKAKYRVGLSGTPIVNRPADLFPILHWLDPVRWPNGFKFMLRYCNGTQGQWGWDFSGTSHLDELNDKLRSTLMVRRMKKDVLKDLPPKLRRVIELPANEKILKLEQEAVKNLGVDLEQLKMAVEMAKASPNRQDYDNAVSALNKGHQAAFEEMAEVRHQTALATLPHGLAHLAACLEDDPDNKIVVFAHHLDVIAAIKAEHPNAAAVVIGGMSSEEKMAQVDRFQKETACKVFIGGLRAAGEGITLTASSHVIFFEWDWTPSKMNQCEDRCHRIGQRDNVLVELLVLARSLSATMAKRVIAKQEICDAILDDATKAELLNEAEMPTMVVLKPGQALPERKERKERSATFKQVEQEAETITPEIIELAHAGLKRLAGVCDGAFQLDGMGFNRIDKGIGHDFANRNYLTPKQGVIARKLCIKYGGQLGSAFAEPLKESLKAT